MRIAMESNTALAVHQITDEASGPAGSSKSPVPRMPMLAWIGAKAAGPIVLTCVCVALAYSWRKRRAAARRLAEQQAEGDKAGDKDISAAARRSVSRLQRSKTIAELHGGKKFFDKIFEEGKPLNQEELNKEIKKAAERMKKVLGTDTIQFKELKDAATELEMTGSEDEAIDMLREAWEKAKDEKKPHEAHELQMLLAEMLIYKGDYWQALECKCLDERDTADARGPLIKAIVHYIKGDENAAKNYYDEFEKIKLQFHFPDHSEKDGSAEDLVHRIDEFKRIVERLKNEVENARKPKPKA